MNLFISTQEIVAVIDKVSLKRKKKQDELIQVIHLAIKVPTDDVRRYLAEPITTPLFNANDYLNAPKVSGALPENLSGPYHARIWHNAETPAQREEILSDEPFLQLTVDLGRVSLSSSDKFVDMTLNMETVLNQPEIAGLVDQMLGESLMIRFVPLQGEMEMEEA